MTEQALSLQIASRIADEAGLMSGRAAWGPGVSVPTAERTRRIEA